jgi:hypothetical protein
MPWPSNLRDPISLNNRSNWPNNKAVEVNTGRRKNYFTLQTFNKHFGTRWRQGVDPTIGVHPITREPIKRNHVKIITFENPIVIN